MAKKTVYLNPAEFGVGLEGNDKSNCTIRALANATGKPMHECYALLAKYGRERNAGATSEVYYPAYAEAGLVWLGYFGTTDLAYAEAYFGCEKANIKVMRRFSGCTLGSFLKAFPVGTYILSIKSHVLCVKNGVIIDSHANKSTATVLAAWKAQ